MSKQYIFYHDPERCIKCFACEVACKQWHGIKAGTIKLRKVEEVTAGSFPDVKRTFHSISCMHCVKPRCIGACLQGAISKREEDGIVIVDTNKCNGCRSCLEACPIGIPQFDEDGIMRKCDMCLDRMGNGQQPLCVATCPTQALKWGTIKELSDFANKKSHRKSMGNDHISNVTQK
ncbi:MAG: 4Fe-4S dicluster domain-containing protein [Dehalococcoidales bacterium]|jgi:anaerobic dimethyl sulfoxide reductase subunit B (iron-sulfur subunit)